MFAFFKDTTLDELHAAEDQLTKWPVVPGSLADRIRQQCQEAVRNEIDAIQEGLADVR